MIYVAYWRHPVDRVVHHGYVRANDHEDAFAIAQNFISNSGNHVVAVYEADVDEITPESLTINFPNTAERTAVRSFYDEWMADPLGYMEDMRW